VAEPTAIARSPIAPAPPVTVENGWEVSARRSAAALRLTDCTPLAKILLLGPEDEALGVPFGRAERDEKGVLVVGSGPGEWTLFGAPGTGGRLWDLAAAALSPAESGVFDVTHARAAMRTTGPETAALLAKVCAIDLAEDITPDGAAFRSSVAKVVTDVVRDDRGGQPSYLLHCDRALGGYLFDALLDAGAEFDIEVDGFAGPGI
jgi:heterotetrameric sarcosine oxidase gamma subunit